MDFIQIYMMGSLELLAMFHFFTRFLQKKVKILYYIVFLGIGMVVVWGIPAGVVRWIAIILLLAAGGVFIPTGRDLSVSVYKNGIHLIVCAVMAVEIMNLSFGISDSVLSLLSPLLFPLNPGLVSLGFSILGNVLSLGMTIFCYLAVCRYFSYEKIMENQCWLVFFIPIGMILLTSGYITMSVYGGTMELGIDGKIIGIEHFLMFAMELSGLVGLFCMTYVLRKLIQNSNEITRLSFMEKEVEFQHQYVREAQIRYEMTKSFRHDIKNHIAVLKGLIQNRKTAQALKYMGDMEIIAESLSFSYRTGYPVIDILLENKLGPAKSDGIEVNCSLLLPCSCGIRDIDFCIILSNALDNAIHACKKGNGKKYIYVTGNVQGDFILLEIENNFSGKESFKAGTGLANIKSAVEKYHGVMNIKTDGEVFILSVLLNISQRAGSISQQTD